MADIFISYNKQDHAEARLLAAFLEAEGYDVWRDTSLPSGVKFRKVIIEELANAHAAIVIWTENSVTSAWVMSEAERAHADQKLIPVKARGLEYKDIPPPFDNQHTENLDARENILAAVQVQLAKAQPPAPMWKKARLELLTWFGIIGAAVTLAANLREVVQLAVWARSLVENWIVVITWFWETALFFLPNVTRPDAVFLTVMAFITSSFLSASTSNMQITKNGSLLSTVILICCIMSIFAFGYYDAIWPDSLSDTGYSPDPRIPSIYRFYIHLNARYLSGYIILSKPQLILLFVLLLPLLSLVTIVYYLAKLAKLRISIHLLNTRLMRIITGVVLILALNYASLWIEAQPWAKTLLSG